MGWERAERNCKEQRCANEREAGPAGHAVWAGVVDLAEEMKASTVFVERSNRKDTRRDHIALPVLSAGNAIQTEVVLLRRTVRVGVFITGGETSPSFLPTRPVSRVTVFIQEEDHLQPPMS